MTARLRTFGRSVIEMTLGSASAPKPWSSHAVAASVAYPWPQCCVGEPPCRPRPRRGRTPDGAGHTSPRKAPSSRRSTASKPMPSCFVHLVRPRRDLVGLLATQRSSEVPGHFRVGVQGGVAGEVVGAERPQPHPGRGQDQRSAPRDHLDHARRLVDATQPRPFPILVRAPRRRSQVSGDDAARPYRCGDGRFPGMPLSRVSRVPDVSRRPPLRSLREESLVPAVPASAQAGDASARQAHGPDARRTDLCR